MINEEMAPGPDMIGNASGVTMMSFNEDWLLLPSALEKSHFKRSNPIIPITIPPAILKAFISSPNKSKRCDPNSAHASKMPSETWQAFRVICHLSCGLQNGVMLMAIAIAAIGELAANIFAYISIKNWMLLSMKRMPSGQNVFWDYLIINWTSGFNWICRRYSLLTWRCRGAVRSKTCK